MRVEISSPKNSPFLLEEKLPWGQFLVFTRGAPSKQGINEDSVSALWNESKAILAVADGVSGQRGAAEASQESLKVLSRKLKSKKTLKLRNSILDAIEQANQKLLRKGKGSGTTLACAEIQSKSFRPYLVGDSSIFLVGQRGKLRYRSIAHSPVGYALASGLIGEQEAMEHEQNHILWNAIGGADLSIELGPEVNFNELDTLLICSDGLTDLLSVDEIVETIRVGEMKKVLDDLLNLVEQKIKGQEEVADDLSIVLFRPQSGV